MTKKLFLSALAMSALLFASCNKQPNTDHLKPQIKFEQESYIAEVGIAVEIAPAVTNSKGAAYKWETDGKTISTDSLLSFTPTQAKDYALILTVTNQYGENKAQCTLKTAPAAPYRNAVFMMEKGARGDYLGPGNNSKKVNGRLMAIKADGSFENDAFGKANEGKKLGYLCMPPVIFNNKIYILADAGSEDFGKAELVIADALSLKFEKAVTFDTGNERVTSLTIASNEKAYVGTGSRILFPLNLVSGNKGANIEGLPKNFVGNILNPILRIGDKVYGVSAGFKESELCAIDIATDRLSSKKTIEGKILFMLNTADERPAMITEKITDIKPNLIFYSTKTSAVEGEEHPLPREPQFAAAISTKTNELYFHARNKRGEIYRYNYNTKKSELFAKADNVEFARLHTANNKLYYTYKVSTAADQFKTLVYNLEDTAPAKPIGTAASHTNLDVWYAIKY